jgi:hypothetical protein
MLIDLYCAACQETPPGSLPNDDTQLSRVARTTLKKWQIARPKVLAGWTLSEDRFICGWLFKHCVKAQKTSEKRSKASKMRKKRRSIDPANAPAIATANDGSIELQSLKPVRTLGLGSDMPSPTARQSPEPERTESEPISQSSVLQKREALSPDKKDTPPSPPFAPGPFGGRTTPELWDILAKDNPCKTDLLAAKELFYRMKVDGPTLQEMLRVVTREQEDGCNFTSLSRFLSREQWT